MSWITQNLFEPVLKNLGAKLPGLRTHWKREVKIEVTDNVSITEFLFEGEKRAVKYFAS